MSWEIAIVVALVGVSFSLFFLSGTLDKNHYAVKLLLVLVGLFILVTNLGVQENIIQANNATINDTAIVSGLSSAVNGAYTGTLWVSIVVLLYFILYFIWQVVHSMRVKKNAE